MQHTNKTNTFKKTVSLLLGIPSAFLMFCEVEDLNLWWIPFVAMAVLFGVLKWNNLISKEINF